LIFLLSLAIGVLYAGAIYMMLRRSITKVVIGLALISHAANLLIFTAGGVKRGKAPLLSDQATPSLASFADPLPQALILTAIVISFGVLAFSITLLHRTAASAETDDIQQIGTKEE
jgi:multicomponent Na+:H+ antiporter subunit C